MKSLKEGAFEKLHTEVFTIYPLDKVIQLAEKILRVKKYEGLVLKEELIFSLKSVLGKTETFNTLLTLVNLDRKYVNDLEMQSDMKDLSFNAHCTIALNICDMYGTGATRFFGIGDLFYEDFFMDVDRESHRFISKGIIALAASAAANFLGHGIREVYIQKNIEILEQRGITMKDMVDELLALQKPYNKTLTYDDCKEHILGVLAKQQVYHAIKLSYKIDLGVENNEFDDQFQEIVGSDEGLYGIDESLNMGISKLYGMIAITNFGLLDKLKPGIIQTLDSDHSGGRCNTFMDDTVCAIISAGCGRLAHNNVNNQSKPEYHSINL
jgi:phosphatidylglycerophosphatase A